MTPSVGSFDVAASTREIAASIEEDGGAIVRELAPEALMDEVYDEIQSRVSEADQTSATILWPEGNKTIGALAAVSPLFANQLLVHPKILEIADAMLLPARPMTAGANASPVEGLAKLVKNDHESTQLVWTVADSETGPNCDHYNLGAAVMLEVRGGGEHQMLHRENAIYQPYVGHLPMRAFIMSVLWAGTEFTKENGATRVVPGSHRWPEDRIAEEGEITQAEMPKGSALIWLSRTLHGAGRSRSPERRTGYFSSFIPDWLRQEENQYIAVPPDVAEKLSDTARKIVGYSSSYSLGWVKGRDQENLLISGKSGPIS